MAAAEPAAKRTKGEIHAFVAEFPGLLDEIITDLEAHYPDFDKGAIEYFKKVTPRRTWPAFTSSLT
jgi:hypothetical protein